jgi:hypothetical protein
LQFFDHLDHVSRMPFDGGNIGTMLRSSGSEKGEVIRKIGYCYSTVTYTDQYNGFDDRGGSIPKSSPFGSSAH